MKKRIFQVALPCPDECGVRWPEQLTTNRIKEGPSVQPSKKEEIKFQAKLADKNDLQNQFLDIGRRWRKVRKTLQDNFKI